MAKHLQKRSMCGKKEPGESTSKGPKSGRPPVRRVAGQAVRGWTVDEVAAMYATSASTVRRLIKTGDLRAISIGTPRCKVYRLTPQQLDDFDAVRVCLVGR